MTDRLLIDDGAVERVAEAVADEFGYALDSERHEEMYDAAYWKQIARRALEAALEEQV